MTLAMTPALMTAARDAMERFCSKFGSSAHKCQGMHEAFTGAMSDGEETCHLPFLWESASDLDIKALSIYRINKGDHGGAICHFCGVMSPGVMPGEVQTQVPDHGLGLS